MENVHISSKSQYDNTTKIKEEICDDIGDTDNIVKIKEEQLDNEAHDDIENLSSSFEEVRNEDPKFTCSMCGHMSESENHWLMHKATHLHIVMPSFVPPKNIDMDLLVEKKSKSSNRSLSKRHQAQLLDLDSISELNSSKEMGKRVSRQGHKCRNCNKVFKFRTELLEHCEEKHTPKNATHKRRVTKSPRKSVKTKPLLRSPSKSSSDDDEMEDEDVTWDSNESDDNKHDSPSYKKAKKVKIYEELTESVKKVFKQVSRNFICRTCGLVFTRVSHLHEHVFKEHVESSKQQSPEDLPSLTEERIENNTTDDASTALQGETWIEIDDKRPIIDTGNKTVFSKDFDNGNVEISDYNGNMNVNFTINQQSNVNAKDGYNCDECEEVFPLRSDLEQHISTKHIITIFPCPYCEQLFTDLKILQKHGLEEHDNSTQIDTEKPSTPVKESKSSNVKDCDENFICSMCKMVFTKKKDIRNHIFLAHMVESNGEDYRNDNSNAKVDNYDIPAVFVCKICYKEFYTEDDLQQHFVESHKTIKNDKIKNNAIDFKANRRKQKIVTRKYDELTVLNMKNLKNTKPVQHFNILKEYLRASESSNDFDVYTTEDDRPKKENANTKVTTASKNKARSGEHKIFICPHCQQSFQGIAKLRSHILKKHSDFYFDGLIEQFKLVEAPEIEEDLIQKVPKQSVAVEAQATTSFVCTICKQEYANQKFLDAHVFNKHVHRCGYCHRVFHCAEHVAKHVFEKHVTDEVHDDNNFEMYTFHSVSRKEMKDEDNVYECHMCDKRTSVWRYLQDHRRRVHKLVNLYKTFSKKCAQSGCKTDRWDSKKWYHKCGLEILENPQAIAP